MASESRLDPTLRRRLRWAFRGALALASFAILIGTLFNVLVGYALGEIPPEAGVAFWARFLLRSALAWGGGGLFFGAVLGTFASMIWRDS
ncbi:MAG: ABC transporter ATP-binding protein [Chloroflexaceae bacterium]